MFAPGGPKPWKTKKGQSRLDALVEQAREKHLTIGDIKEGKASIHEEVKEPGAKV